MEQRPHPRERAQAMTEITLCLPILCVLLIATVQYGVMIWRSMELMSATRDGARQASISRRETDPVGAVRNVVLSSLDAEPSSNVTVTVTGGWAQDSTVTVATSAPYSLDILGLQVWDGTLTKSQRVRIG